MAMNGIKDIYVIAKMTGSELAPMIVKSEDSESRKFYTSASASKFMGVSMPTMHYTYKNCKVKVNGRVGGYKTFCIEWL